MRPIAIGDTICRLVAKCVSKRMLKKFSNYFMPFQLGAGCPNGSEAAAHVAREYISSCPADEAFVKIVIPTPLIPSEEMPFLKSSTKKPLKYCSLRRSATSRTFFSSTALTLSCPLRVGSKETPLPHLASPLLFTPS